MANVTGSDNIGGVNQSATNDFDASGFWFEWIEFTGNPSNLSQVGFNTADGSLGDGQVVFNAGGTDDLNNLASNGSAAVLGNDAERFALRVSTVLTVDEGGEYQFDVTSDDGVILFVDGVQVVNDDSLHAPRTRSGTIDLGPGEHEIVIIYFELTGQNVLEVDVSGPDFPTPIALQDADVQANRLADTVSGGEGNDTIIGGLGDDELFGGTGRDSIEGGEGDDTIDGGGGRDELFGGDGDDQIDGGGGRDEIFGGDGADLIEGGAALDTIEGGIGNDTIDGDGGADQIFGGEGDDVITGGNGNDEIFGGAGADTITETQGSDTISGDAGDDVINVTGGVNNQLVDGGDDNDQITVFNAAASENTLLGGAGNDSLQSGDSTDTLDGGAGDDQLVSGRGDDIVTGGTGDDNLIGFEGADTLDGGEDDDTLDGGDGSDSITGGDGFDDFLVSAGDDTITDFNLATGQVLNDGDQLNNDFIDLAPFYDDIFEARADLADDGLLNQSIQDDTVKTGTVDFADNTALPGTIDLVGVAPDALFFDNTNLICFDGRGQILTPDGEKPLAALRVGDVVSTKDNGAQTVRWIGRRHTVGRDKFAPILIREGQLGALRDTRVSPQHCLLLDHWRGELLFNARQVLSAATHLVGSNVLTIEEVNKIEYVHIAFDAHELVCVDGVWSESLYPGPGSLSAMSEAGREEFLALFPDVRLDMVSGAPARMRLKRHDAFALRCAPGLIAA